MFLIFDHGELMPANIVYESLEMSPMREDMTEYCAGVKRAGAVDTGKHVQC